MLGQRRLTWLGLHAHDRYMLLQSLRQLITLKASEGAKGDSSMVV